MNGKSLLKNALWAIIVALIIVLMVWVPDFTLDEQECMKQDSSAYVKNLCSESKAK
jgi:hypothetical protein